MFGVTTSDDYRPVTWMGRYPVDVTTILVGVHVGVFAAFVTLYPNVQFFLRIPAKWIFAILAAIGTLSDLAAHDWQDLVVLWASIGVAFGFIEMRGAGPELAWLSNFKARLRPK